MEKLVTIQKQFPLTELNYQDRQGQPQTLAIRGFVMSDGIDQFYAEAVGDMARRLPTLDLAVMHSVQLQITMREYQDKDEKTHYSNEVRIVRIV